MPMTKEQLIAELDRARDEMRALLQELDTAQEVYPTWTVKELLAHMTGWDEDCIASLSAHMAGAAPEVPAANGFDPYNAANIHERQAMTLQQTIQEWEATREKFKKMILDVPEEKMHQPFVFPWGPSGALEQMVMVFAEHEREHAEEIREKAQGK